MKRQDNHRKLTHLNNEQMNEARGGTVDPDTVPYEYGGENLCGLVIPPNWQQKDGENLCGLVEPPDWRQTGNFG
jgi:hypothetical protein